MPLGKNDWWSGEVIGATAGLELYGSWHETFARELQMISLHLDRTLLLSFLGAEAVAVLGMALFLWWAIRAVGLFRAAANGKAFADSVEEARASVNAAAMRAATQIASYDDRVLVLVQQVDEVSKRLKQVTPQSIQIMVTV